MSEEDESEIHLGGRLQALSETELVEHIFQVQYADKTVGFMAYYVPQFSKSDSEPVCIKGNHEILVSDDVAKLRSHLTSLEFNKGRQFVNLSLPELDGISTTQRVMRFDSDVVVGVFIFFSPHDINETRINWFVEYCVESIKLRKRSEALSYISETTNRFPEVGTKEFFPTLGNAVTSAMRSAETLILMRNQSTFNGYETVFSSGSNTIDVPDGVPSAVAKSIEDGNLQVNNDVFQVRKNLPRSNPDVHNIKFFEKNDYSSYISFSVLREDPVFGFSIFCFYKRPYAISSLERELFEAFCLIIEGLYRRAIYQEGNQLSEKGEKLQKILKQSLLIADIMHDATEDLVFVRNSLGSVKAKDETERQRLNESRQILIEIIDAARSFKETISDGIPTFQIKGRKKKPVKIRALVQGVLDKYKNSGDYDNIDFTNKIDSKLQTFAVSYSLRRALDNAVKNSVKHLQDVSHRRRFIEVTATKNADELELTIYDNGRGMTEEEQERCVELLFSSTEGMGFGMSIIEAAALAHNGKLIVESELGIFCRLRIFLEYR